MEIKHYGSHGLPIPRFGPICPFGPESFTELPHLTMGEYRLARRRMIVDNLSLSPKAFRDTLVLHRLGSGATSDNPELPC